MRKKEEILAESLKQASQVPAWDATASLHERLQIEVLIDIRDELTALKQVLSSFSDWKIQLP